MFEKIQGELTQGIRDPTASLDLTLSLSLSHSLSFVACSACSARPAPLLGTGCSARAPGTSREDLSDLVDRLDWATQNEEESERIATMANRFATRYLSLEPGRARLRDALGSSLSALDDKVKTSPRVQLNIESLARAPPHLSREQS